MTSGHDIGTVPGFSPEASVVHAYTKTWNNAWANSFEHLTSDSPGRPLIDGFTIWDAARNRYVFAGVEYQTVGNSIWLHFSTDSGGGASWSTPVKAMPGSLLGPIAWDFPSVALNASTGRIVVGASQLTQNNSGYWTSYSDDGGVTWNGPFPVNGTTGGATSRIVWSTSGYHAFIQETFDPANWVLMHWQSSDGQNWTRQADVATYGMPAFSSPENVVSGNPSGQLSYAATPNAVSSSSLGWFVAYPVNIGGRNAINVSTEHSGGVTINYTTDSFNAGITASTSGDWYLTYQTFQGGDQVVPVQQNAVYRTPADGYLGAIIQGTIDPSKWFYYNSNSRCIKSSPCYTPGDYFRPAMNSFSGATVPIIVGSPNTNDLMQAFIRDPQSANVPQFVPTTTPFKTGGNLSNRAIFTNVHLAHIAAQHHKFMTSSMTHARLLRAGLVN